MKYISHTSKSDKRLLIESYFYFGFQCGSIGAVISEMSC